MVQAPPQYLARTGIMGEAFFVTTLLLLFFYVSNTIQHTIIQQSHFSESGQYIQPIHESILKSGSSSPVRLKIPSIHLSAPIVRVGITDDGIMEVPGNIANAGWFDLGPRPGDIGSAVIDGHLNGMHGEAGVFANLDKLHTGEKLYIEDSKGTDTVFIVQHIRNYNTDDYAEEVFAKNDSAHLNLITCAGSWDKNKQSYTKRLVVFADVAT